MYAIFSTTNSNFYSSAELIKFICTALREISFSPSLALLFDVVFYLVEGELSRNTDSKHTQVIRIVTLEGLMARGRQSGKELAHKNRSE